MRRRLFTFMSAVSLLLCAATAVLWAWSYYRGERWATNSHPGIRWEVRSASGWLTVERHQVLSWPDFGSRRYWSLGGPDDSPVESSGFFGPYVFRRDGYVRERLPGEPRPFDRPYPPAQAWFHLRRVGVPYPLVFALSSVFPAFWVWRVRARRRRERTAGLCPACGYDLRATPDRCPECGAAPNARDAGGGGEER